MNSETQGLKWEIQMKKTNMLHYLPKHGDSNMESNPRQSHLSQYSESESVSVQQPNVNVYEGYHTIPLPIRETGHNSQRSAYAIEEAQELQSSENETLKLRREYLKTQVALLEAQKDNLDKSNLIRGLVSESTLNEINPHPKYECDDRYKKLVEELQQQVSCKR
ncbi:hypothetical protein P879_05608 [Paragonimus westermani]|uniref:Uncharacterized protein n=1 Tax=Paragonimus westermani TaxID=34504 RepID=A0A8T0DVE4_9TREM|nr:hypothetical protein P879_05608 [Paragonimus westermani]